MSTILVTQASQRKRTYSTLLVYLYTQVLASMVITILTFVNDLVRQEMQHQPGLNSMIAMLDLSTQQTLGTGRLEA